MKKSLSLIFCLSFFQLVNAATPLISAAASFLAPKNSSDSTFLRRDTLKTTAVFPAIPDQNAIMQGRLDSVKKEVPLLYNEFVQTYIDLYTRNHYEMAKVIGLAKYYFPIYEKAFCEAGIPDEIKYLSIVESKLDPYAISRVGATGPWQFMPGTARSYHLNMDKYVDERRDPIQASYAAAAYLRDSYNEFGDWLLAIASYNCGTSNVERAIRKAGGVKDFWTIRQYLPNETKNYVPAFIAMNYIMNYFEKQNIIPQASNMSAKTDTIMVNRYISLSKVSQVLDMDAKELALLNPAYKKQIINGTTDVPRRLIIPQIDHEKFGALYEVLNDSTANATAERDMIADNKADEGEVKKQSVHKVRRGETLREIAENFGVGLKELKIWNHLHSNKATPGEKLKLTEPVEEVASASSVKHHSKYVTYKVKSGDTLSGIASRFDGVSVEKIKSINGLKKDRLHPGMTIRI